MRKIIVLALCSVLVVIGLVFIILSATLKPKKVTPVKAKRIKRNYMIIGVISIVIGIIAGLSYFLMYPKYIANKMLEESNPQEYSKLCDELFETTATEGVASDFLRMKAEKTIKEVQTMCGNYAKRILNKK
jgi:hypothetical protein